MSQRDALGLLLFAAGLVLAATAWNVGRRDWALVAAVLLVLGILLLWRRKRADAIEEATADMHAEGLGVRLGRRRDWGDDDGGGADAGGD